MGPWCSKPDPAAAADDEGETYHDAVANPVHSHEQVAVDAVHEEHNTAAVLAQFDRSLDLGLEKHAIAEVLKALDAGLAKHAEGAGAGAGAGEGAHAAAAT